MAETCTADAGEQEQPIVTCYVLIEALVPLMLLSGHTKRATSAIAMLADVRRVRG